MITFIHTADIHFGMENYGRIDSKTGIHSRLLDFERALNACIDTAINKRVDFFLFCGDAYKTAHPSPTQQKLLLRCFLKLYQARIPVIIIIGNHDNPITFGKAHSLDLFDALPFDAFHVIARPTAFSLLTRSGPVQIVGIPWPTRTSITLNKYQHTSSHDITVHITQSVDAIIKEFAKKLNPRMPAIFASHLTVSSGIFSGSEKRAIYGTDPTFLPSQLTRQPFDYVALGHLHRHQDLHTGAHPPVVYSGSIERIDFGERKEPKGFCLVTLHDKTKTSYEFIEVPTRPFLQFDIILSKNDDQTEQIIKQLKTKNLSGAIVKIVYHVPINTNDNVNIARIEHACKEALDLVSIIPVRTTTTRTQRTDITLNTNLKKLLLAYFDNKQELAEQKHTLTEKALCLYDELKQKEH